MSHHLDSPTARQDVRLDITDLYVFDGDGGTALMLNVCHSLGGATTPGFHPEGRYEFKIDLNGDSTEDLTYRATFTETDTQGRQNFTIHRIAGAAATDPFAEGVLILSGHTNGPVETDSGARAWAAKVNDPFWIDPDVLHAVGHAFHDGTRIDLGDWQPTSSTNLFAGETVYTLLLELPHEELTPRSVNNRIGVWAVASLATDAGGWRPINRVGLPMIHPLFGQFDDKLGDELNTGVPADDYANYGDTIGKKVAGVVSAYGTARDPVAYGRQVAQRLFPNILPYTVGTPATFGFAGWNGRTLTDNTPEVMASLATNTAVMTGTQPDSAITPPSQRFPYVAPAG
ncbi:hypothetical protein ASE48_13790 [Mycobacterium sp. Root265]|uniref:DUF4331 family protein n=1 Tax=Mycobacterium sp. Root265 TaxID=1736504 RepID=UPI00070F2C5A|nr:DUF4331 family protein [Mycobacterium sp. Root265]KRD06996.1 hypothetical protein ASE48_13790 [Mycobacterium sp. Root265]